VDQLMTGVNDYTVLYDFEHSTPANFAFSPDGRYLFGSSYYSGVSNIVRYDFHNSRMEWVTNTESGLFRPIPVSDDSLIAFHFTAKGFLPVMLPNQTVEDVSAINYLGQRVVETHPDLEHWALKPPSMALSSGDSVFTVGEYSPMQHLSLASMYPIVEGYKEFPAYGLRFNLSDPAMLHSMDFTASYSPNRLLSAKERLHASFGYSFWQWRVSGSYNGADFYDLFGPTKTSRKGYAARVNYRNYLLYDEPEIIGYSITLAGYGDLERLPDYQNIGTTFDRFYTLSGRLGYSNLTASLGAVESESGLEASGVSYSTYVNAKIFQRIIGNASYGFLLPLNHSSIWLRVSAGYSFGERSQPFANFFFGGFGNNWIDHQEIRRYRQDYSFPGIELNSVGGTRYGKAMVEWTLPPLRFRHLGFPEFYCNWARLALFTTGIVANPDSRPDRRTLFNVGSQVDFRLVLMSSLESTLSLGYAGAFEKSRKVEKEFMISLKILR